MPDLDKPTERATHGQRHSLGKAERDLVALGIATAAILMFVGTGSTVFSQAIRAILGHSNPPDPILLNALLLNVALIIFGWRRYRQLREEIDERRKAESLARTLAETDSLTGMLNRRSMDSQTERLIATSQSRREVVAMILIDIDNFKSINDLNGHYAGDRILQECSRRIRDVVPANAICARLGGDEFACVMPTQPGARAAVDRIAAAIVESVARPVNVNGISLSATASAGIATSDMKCACSDGPAGAYALSHMADIAMYNSKKLGRNCRSWFEQPMESELEFRRTIEQGIRDGIERGEFVPYYERQIDLHTGELTGFEVLARWKSPDMCIVNPDVFIPVAEEIGAIGALSESVIAQALEDARNWDPSLTLAVNISPIQLRDPWFSQKILKLLINANFPPERFEIEITESCLHENIGIVRSLIASLKSQGICVTLDDFGTGYSSIAQLRSLPFDRLKIDRSFVMTLLDNEESETLVHAMALLGAGLGLPVTAEGIEEAEVIERLGQYKNMKGQGYLYGRPQPASVVGEMLSQKGMLAISDMREGTGQISLAAENDSGNTGGEVAASDRETPEPRRAGEG